MPRTVNPFKLGLFIIICGVLGLIAIIWLGASHYFEERRTYVSYFDESVKGLQKDAVVNYRGVSIGRVADVRLAPDGRLIEVLMHLHTGFKVDMSLAIRMREQGLTGMRYLEIDTAPENLDKLTPKILFSLPYPIIRSYPSEMEQLKNALQDMYGRLSALDIEGLIENWTKTAEQINSVLVKIEGVFDPNEWKEIVEATKKTARASADLTERLSNATSQKGMNKGIEDLAATLQASRQASELLAKRLSELPPNSLANMANTWNEATTAGGNLFTDLDRQLSESIFGFQQSLQQLKILITQLNGLVQTLKEQPSRVIFPSNEPDPFRKK